LIQWLLEKRLRWVLTARWKFAKTESVSGEKKGRVLKVASTVMKWGLINEQVGGKNIKDRSRVARNKKREHRYMVKGWGPNTRTLLLRR